MILTVTLNAAVDKTYRIDGFALDRVHRPSESRIVAGGKGINVARVYRRLGGEAVATGFLGGYNGEFIARSLEDEGIRAECVTTTGESRVCIAAVDPLARTQTEINEVGPSVQCIEVSALRKKIACLLAGGCFRTLALCGSVPPGVDDGIYAELIELARSLGVRCALDASGGPLQLGAASGPWLIKPNLAELGQLAGREPVDVGGVVESARAILDTGVEVVAATLGTKGCVCVSASVCVHVAAPRVPFVSAVGSGDAFLAAMLRGFDQGGSLLDAARLGVGAGAANACVYGAGFVEETEVRRLAQIACVTPASMSAKMDVR